MDGAMHGPWEFYRLDGSLMRAGSLTVGARSESGEPMPATAHSCRERLRRLTSPIK